MMSKLTSYLRLLSSVLPNQESSQLRLRMLAYVCESLLQSAFVNQLFPVCFVSQSMTRRSLKHKKDMT